MIRPVMEKKMDILNLLSKKATTTNQMYNHFRSTGHDDKGGLIKKLHDLYACGIIDYQQPNQQKKLYSLTEFGCNLVELHYLSKSFFDSLTSLKSIDFNKVMSAKPYQLIQQGWTKEEIANRLDMAIRCIKFKLGAWTCYFTVFTAKYSSILLKFKINKEATSFLEQLSRDLLLMHLKIGEYM